MDGDIMGFVAVILLLLCIFQLSYNEFEFPYSVQFSHSVVSILQNHKEFKY